MKLHFLNRTSLQHSSFTISDYQSPHFLKIWHYHHELELVVIKKSVGTKFIGDHISKFEEGEVVLIGKDLPHMWLNEEAYFREDSKLEAKALAIHFKRDFLGNDFFKTPEMLIISELMDKANQGILFKNVPSDLQKKIESLSSLQTFERLYSFIGVLHSLAIHPYFEFLASSGYINSFKKTEIRSLDKTYEFIYKNFDKAISLQDIADIAGMNPSAFCRFFKRIHKVTFTHYLNEIRIGFACKLLIENKYNITRICYESGFNNISNFNRQFKTITGMSPTKYVNLHSKKV